MSASHDWLKHEAKRALAYMTNASTGNGLNAHSDPVVIARSLKEALAAVDIEDAAQGQLTAMVDDFVQKAQLTLEVL